MRGNGGWSHNLGQLDSASTVLGVEFYAQKPQGQRPGDVGVLV